MAETLGDGDRLRCVFRLLLHLFGRYFHGDPKVNPSHVVLFPSIDSSTHKSSAPDAAFFPYFPATAFQNDLYFFK